MGKKLTRITSLKELQGRLLEILKIFHSFCKENGLEYALAYGSCLGAVRHKGFIPWDDDVDVVMPRSDYEKLSSLASNHLIAGRLEVKSNKQDPAYPYPYIKIVDTETIVIEKQYKPYPIGLFIDVFPIDNIPSEVKRQKKTYDRIHMQQMMLCGSFGRYEKRGTGFWDYTLGCIGTFFLHRIYKKVRKHYCRKMDRTAQSFNSADSAYEGCIVWGTDYKNEVLDKGILFPHSDGCFEGAILNLPNNPDAYLSILYGDYMTMPPQEDRKPHDFEAYLIK